MFSRSRQVSQSGARVSLVTPDAKLESRLQAVLRNGAGIKLQTIQTNLRKLNGERKLLINDDLLIVDMNPENDDELQSLERIVANREPHKPIIVVAENLAGTAARRLLHLHITDWLPRGGDDNEFVQACKQALKSQRATRQEQATCIAFLPALGGVGNTTLAIASAFVLGAKKGGLRPTCVVDVNFQSGMVADYLDLEPNLQLDEVSISPERLDFQLVEMMLSRHQSGLSVLAAPQSLRTDLEIEVEGIAKLLDIAASEFENVVIDMPTIWTPWSEIVMQGADHIFIVTELTVPGLRQAKRRFDELSKAYGETINLSVIINKYTGGVLGGGLKQKDAKALFDKNLLAKVSDCGRVTREAIDRGVPLSQVRRSNKIDKDLSIILAPYSASS